MAYVDVVNTLNPVAYWRLSKTSGATAFDKTGAYTILLPSAGQ